MTKRLEILKESLIKKEQQLEARFDARFKHQEITNGQPMNDKRNGYSWFAKKDKLDDAIRNQMASIEKTKEAIAKEDVDQIILYGRVKINSQYNEISPALSIFDKHWDGLSEANRGVIWKYLKVLISLSEKSQSVRV